ncbi:MAG: hypothetical protein K2K97_06200, partial [Muribaculaceae bacterium]|nr:hypothetical protein [Muribaculaceae bacterium]
VVYNALWVFTHFSDENIQWLRTKRNFLIDILLNKFDYDAGAKREGKVRMTLALLERLPISAEDVRTDYLDYCLARINSLEPYGIRALCMKQAYRQCCYYPELLNELRSEIELMDTVPLSPGLEAARRNLMSKLQVK